MKSRVEAGGRQGQGWHLGLGVQVRRLSRAQDQTPAPAGVAMMSVSCGLLHSSLFQENWFRSLLLTEIEIQNK